MTIISWKYRVLSWSISGGVSSSGRYTYMNGNCCLFLSYLPWSIKLFWNIRKRVIRIVVTRNSVSDGISIIPWFSMPVHQYNMYTILWYHWFIRHLRLRVNLVSIYDKPVLECEPSVQIDFKDYVCRHLLIYSRRVFSLFPILNKILILVIIFLVNPYRFLCWIWYMEAVLMSLFPIVIIYLVNNPPTLEEEGRVPPYKFWFTK